MQTINEDIWNSKTANVPQAKQSDDKYPSLESQFEHIRIAVRLVDTQKGRIRELEAQLANSEKECELRQRINDCFEALFKKPEVQDALKSTPHKKGERIVTIPEGMEVICRSKYPRDYVPFPFNPEPLCGDLAPSSAWTAPGVENDPAVMDAKERELALSLQRVAYPDSYPTITSGERWAFCHGVRAAVNWFKKTRGIGL